MAKHSDKNNGKFEKSGYTPLNEGYSPKGDRGYSPKAENGNLPRAPRGGTGESIKPIKTDNPRAIKK